jgi:hypothetical protein
MTGLSGGRIDGPGWLPGRDKIARGSRRPLPLGPARLLALRGCAEVEWWRPDAAVEVAAAVGRFEVGPDLAEVWMHRQRLDVVEREAVSRPWMLGIR